MKCKHCKDHISPFGSRWIHAVLRSHIAEPPPEGVLLVLETEEMPNKINFNIEHTGYLYDL
jgi:hypothetical protein